MTPDECAAHPPAPTLVNLRDSVLPSSTDGRVRLEVRDERVDVNVAAKPAGSLLEHREAVATGREEVIDGDAHPLARRDHAPVDPDRHRIHPSAGGRAEAIAIGEAV